MLHIDSANQEVCTQLLRLYNRVNNIMLHRLPTYVVHLCYINFYLAATVAWVQLLVMGGSYSWVALLISD